MTEQPEPLEMPEEITDLMRQGMTDLKQSSPEDRAAACLTLELALRAVLRVLEQQSGVTSTEQRTFIYQRVEASILSDLDRIAESVELDPYTRESYVAAIQRAFTIEE